MRRLSVFAEVCRFQTIQSLEVQEIWQKKFRNDASDLSQKVCILTEGIFRGCDENDLRRITKTVSVKLLLEQFIEGILCELVVGKS